MVILVFFPSLFSELYFLAGLYAYYQPLNLYFLVGLSHLLLALYVLTIGFQDPCKTCLSNQKHVSLNISIGILISFLMC